MEQNSEVHTPFWAASVEVFTIMKKTWTIMDATAGNTRIALNVTSTPLFSKQACANFKNATEPSLTYNCEHRRNGKLRNKHKRPFMVMTEMLAGWLTQVHATKIQWSHLQGKGGKRSQKEVKCIL